MPATLGERLRQVRGDLTQKELGQKSGVSASSISAIEQGRRNGGIRIIICLSSAMNISPLWLMYGPPYSKTKLKYIKLDGDGAKRRIKQARLEKELSVKQLASRVHVEASAIYKLEDGRSLRPPSLKRLAAVLGVSEGWLLFGDEANENR